MGVLVISIVGAAVLIDIYIYNLIVITITAFTVTVIININICNTDVMLCYHMQYYHYISLPYCWNYCYHGEILAKSHGLHLKRPSMSAW